MRSAGVTQHEKTRLAHFFTGIIDEMSPVGSGGNIDRMTMFGYNIGIIPQKGRILHDEKEVCLVWIG